MICLSRFYVWGAGKRGGDVVNALGQDRVIAFIESDSGKVGTLYRGLPVISYSSFQEAYHGEFVIVTPEGHEDAIREQLVNDGITRAFRYSDDFLAVETYMLQVNKNRIFQRVDLRKKQYVYGFSLLGLLIYEDLAARGCECSFVLPEGCDSPVPPEEYGISGMETADFLHSAMPIRESTYSGEHMDYYNLIDTYDFHREELEQFRNRHKGERCFIVATGPSLRMEDLDMLKAHNEICISMNGIYKAFEYTGWRPTYYMMADPNAMYFNRTTLETLDVPYIMLSDTISDTINRPNVYRWHLRRRFEMGVKPLFSDDFSRGSFAGLTVTYDGALQFAAFMGFLEIYLLGVDCDNYRDSGTVHFWDKPGKKLEEGTRLLDVEQNILAYESAKEYAEEHGIKIRNATRGGKLEVFERVDFDRLFS